MATPHKRKTLSLDTKFELITAVENNVKSKSEIAKDFGIKPSTLTMILKQRATIIEAMESGDFSPKRKRMRMGNYTEIEECLFKWFINARSSDIAISGEVLAEKSEEFAKKLGIADNK